MSLQSGGRESARRVSARNPRRRQRLDTDSLGHQPRRKRSKVTAENFESASTAGGEHHADGFVNGSHETRSRRSATPSEALDFPLRSKKALQKRGPRGDAGAIMTQDAHYTLRQLSTTPNAIRQIPSSFHGSILTSPSLALVVTREHAYIWDYTTSTSTTQPRSFSVPYQLKQTDPVPFGHLVTNGASAAVGLVLVSASTGDISFWENIDTAESLSLFQDKNTGVKGSLGGLFSGETVSDITSAEHAGIILTLSSGRIAQVSLRDAQGRPKIQAQFLKSQNESGKTGLLGSFRGFVRASWKRELAAVRIRSQGSKGQLQIIAATTNAQIQVWDLAWSGQCSQITSIDFLALLRRELDGHDSTPSTKNAALTVVDFDVLPTRTSGSEIAMIGDEGSIDLVFLVRNHLDRYSLVEVTLAGSKAYIERVTGLKDVWAQTPDEKPRLLLPKPGHSAIVSFARAIAVVSLGDVDSSGPEAQLLMEAHAAPKIFQDVIRLQSGSSAYVQDVSAEGLDERTNASISIFFIHGFGLARFEVPQPSVDASIRVTIKSRLEQAVYFGTDPQNILDFQDIDPATYSAEEVDQAVIAVSEDLLSSSSPYLPTNYTTLNDQIEARLQACRALVAFMQRHFSPISKTLNWRLLTNTEKLQAGLQLWLSYQKQCDDPEEPNPTVLPAVIKVLQSRARGGRQSKATELDELRDWFTHDLGSIDQLVLQALSLVNNGYRDPKIKEFIKLLKETDDVIFNVFKSVFAFRTENAAFYGIDPKVIPDGVLEDNWEDLPEPWTATHELLNLFDKFIDISRTYMIEFYDSKSEATSEIDEKTISSVVNGNVDLITILCKCYRERIGWCSQHYSEKHRHYAPGLQDKFTRSRDHHLKGLIKIGQAGRGLDIAEKYQDMESLVRLVMSETAYLAECLAEPDISAKERGIINDKMDDLQAKVQRYFQVHGDSFANAFFDSHLAGHRSFGLLEEQSIFQEPLTRYLRAEGSRGRLGWIHEVLDTKDLKRAQTALQTLARDHENRLWSKEVELSLSKLTALAVLEKEQPSEKSLQVLADRSLIQSLDSDLLVAEIQSSIYAHIQPLIKDAMDHEAEVQLVTDVYAAYHREDCPALHQLLDVSFDELLDHVALVPEQLIDVLTLMDSVPSDMADDPTDISGKEFYLAVRVLYAAKSSMSGERVETLWRIIWKRLFLMDDWQEINKTSNRSDLVVQDEVKQTLLCRTVALGLTNVLGPDSSLAVPRPEDCVGAGSTAEDISYRFPTPDIRDPIVRDNAKQDARLKECVNKYNLSTKWFDMSIKLAKEVAEEQAQATLEAERGFSSLNGSITESDLHLSNGSALNEIADDDVNDSLDEVDAEPDVEQQTTAATSLADEAESNGDFMESEPAIRSSKSKLNGGPLHKGSQKSQVDGKENQDVPNGKKSQRRLRSRGKDLEGDVDMS